MKNILVPTDFSECAQNATLAAMSMAVKLKATIHFLHILPDPGVAMHPPQTSTAHAATGHAQNELNTLASKASQLGLNAFPLLVFDKGNERIEHYCKPFNIDLIIMGSHGATGIREFVIGSTTQLVVRHATVPVLVIKNQVTDQFKADNIVFAAAFNKQFSVPILLIQLARLWKATIHLFFINFLDKIIDQHQLDDLVSTITQPYPDITFTTNSAQANDEEFGIHQFTKMVNADLIAITPQDKTGFLLRHSVAEDLVNHEAVPVLVIADPVAQ